MYGKVELEEGKSVEGRKEKLEEEISVGGMYGKEKSLKR
jgi:hypothetical protein